MTVIKDKYDSDSLEKEIIFWNNLKNGNKSGLEGLYSMYAKELFRYGMAVSKNKELVKDAIQDLFIDLWRYRKNLKNTDNVKRYICKSLTNRIIKATLKEKIRSQPDIHELKYSIYDGCNAPVFSDSGEEELLKSKLFNALDKLPQRQKKVIQLVYFDKLCGDKIAQAMGINLQSVYNLTSKALVNLRKGLISFLLVFNFLN
ncbi:MAG: sigma-70 family RNA polymerase sigma factor [Cyclobacteriaceae bacterium]